MARQKQGTRPASGGYAPEQTRRALLDKALELFGRQGYALTSVQEITEAAGVTKGAFYHHFDSKEALLKVIHDEFVDIQLDMLKQALDKEQDPADRLRDLLHAFLVTSARYQANVTVFYRERGNLSGKRFADLRHKRDEFDRLFLEAIELGVKEGAFRPELDARMVSLGILGMCAWVHQWYRRNGRLSPDQIADTFAEMILAGVLVDPDA